MDTPASTCQRCRSTRAVPGDVGRHLDSASGMRDAYIADGDVGHLTHRTNVSAAHGVLVLGGQQNAKASLAEASPAVFHKICLDQHANRILEFQVILDDKWIAIGSPNEVRVPLHPI